jgi:hypothetical protein
LSLGGKSVAESGLQTSSLPPALGAQPKVHEKRASSAMGRLGAAEPSAVRLNPRGVANNFFSLSEAWSQEHQLTAGIPMYIAVNPIDRSPSVVR